MADDTFDTSKFYELLNNNNNSINNSPSNNDLNHKQLSPLRFNSTPTITQPQGESSPVYPNGSRFFPSPLRSPLRSQSALGLTTPQKQTIAPIKLDWLDADLSLNGIDFQSPSSPISSSPILKRQPIKMAKLQLPDDSSDISPSNSNFPSPKIAPISFSGRQRGLNLKDEPSTRLLHYIHGIITRHDLELREYIVSVPEFTPMDQVNKLINKVFKSIGDIVSINEIPSFNLSEPFKKFKVETWVFISNLLTTTYLNSTGPWKSIKFNYNGKDLKMLIFLDSIIKKETNEPFKINSIIPTRKVKNVFEQPIIPPFTGFNGSSKLQVCWYPEGYSSTLHSRGDDQFMYARELPSKLNITRQRKGNLLQEMCEIKISVPNSKQGINNVSIDIRELDGKPQQQRDSISTTGKFNKRNFRGNNSKMK